jgi:Pyridoxal-dependent decarboxylase conserved domain
MVGDMTADPLARAHEHARTYLDGLADRPVATSADLDAMRAAFGGPLPEGPSDSADVIDRLVAAAEPGLVSSAGPRYFGFVTGGSVPASVAADWLTSVWDQNTALAIQSPAAAVCEQIVGEWLVDLLGIPHGAGVGLVTGGQMANTTCLAVARTSALRRAGFDPDRDGLAGCPPVTVIVGSEAHTTIGRSLKFLGIGSTQIRMVAADKQGRIIAEALGAELAKLAPGTPTIVCAQAGNVNSPTRAPGPVHGCISTGRSGSGQPRPLLAATSPKVITVPTHGRSISTNGSMSRTSRGSPS